MNAKEMREAMKVIEQIKERLDRLEETAAWIVLAGNRFEKGDRVRFSPRAERKGMTARRKGGVRTGRVVSVGDAYWMDVKLDGYKKASSYHHAFFDHASGKRGRR